MQKSFHINTFLRYTTLTLVIGFILPGVAMVPHNLAGGTVKRVVIDAGHGGRDAGNLGTGRYKSREKHISLEVALMVGNYIKENIPDVEVVYTRNSDKFVELRERTAMANRANADLFISIHCNAHTTGAAYGTETFVMGLTREKANLDVAKRENSVIFLEEDYEKNYEGYDPNDPQGAIVAQYSSYAYLDQSVRLGQLIQDQFRDRVSRHDRGVKQSVLYVLDFTAMPSVLIELGFLTNKKEEDFLNTTRGKELMASAIYRAFRDYKKEADELDKINNQESKIIEQVKEETTNRSIAISAEPEKTKNMSNSPVYKIQITTTGSKIDLVPSNFNGLEDVTYYEQKGVYKYTYGAFTTLEEANKKLPLVREKGFKDAFVVAFLKEERISVSKAAQIQP